jgi:hypothetical protein
MGETSPLKELQETAKEARDYLNERSRVVAAGVLAIVWGLLVSAPISALRMRPSSRKVLVLAALLGLLALLFDFLQFSCEYLAARLYAIRLLGPGGRIMFWSKQLMAFLAAAILVVTVIFIVLQGASSEAAGVWRVYKGNLWSESDPHSLRPSTLLLTPANPASGAVSGDEDNTTCSGIERGNSLVLLCPPNSSGQEQIRFSGELRTNGKSQTYQGEWAPTSASLTKGAFSYTYKGTWSKP